jgi:hypothetical protein
LFDLEIGSPNPAAANHPLLKIDSVSAGVAFGSIFGGDPQLTSLSISGLTLNPVVDEHGRSSFSTFLSGMKPRKTELAIDALTLRKIHIAIHVNHKLTQANQAVGEPAGTLDVAQVRAENFVLPGFGRMLGRTAWIKAELENIVCTAPSLETSAPTEGGVPDGLRVARITVELAQAATADTPVTIRTIHLEKPLCAVVYSKQGSQPAVARAIEAVKYGLGAMEAEDGRGAGSPPPQGTGLLIELLTIRNGRFETRGPNAAGNLAYWSLNDFTVDGKDLAYGPEVRASAPGYLEISGKSESSSGPGDFRIKAQNIVGGFPKSSFDFHYKVEGIAAPAFSVASQDANGPGIQSGRMDMLFNGPCREGILGVDGSLTLSKDFEMDSTAANAITSLSRGMPIETIRVRGTLAHPEVTWPSALAGVIGNAIENIIRNDPIGLLNTGGAFTGSAVKQGIRESGKVINKAGDALKKVTGFFSGDNNEDDKR